MRCLAKLPVEQREVIVLKIWHEHTFEEIGGLLDLSPNTAAGRYRYGMQKLRTCLNGELYERLERTGESTTLLDAAGSIGEG
jgi:RNA polymerase sigma-70 factor (ECF subfamily)